MDKIPYEDYEHPYWAEDETEEINALLEPSDFYFIIEDNQWWPETFYIGIIPKRFFDENGFWYDQCLNIGALFKEKLPFEICSNTETAYSCLDENITREEAKAALIKAGFIFEPGILDIS